MVSGTSQHKQKTRIIVVRNLWKRKSGHTRNSRNIKCCINKGFLILFQYAAQYYNILSHTISH